MSEKRAAMKKWNGFVQAVLNKKRAKSRRQVLAHNDPSKPPLTMPRSKQPDCVSRTSIASTLPWIRATHPASASTCRMERRL
jgi:hypothetical protein